MAGQQEDQGLFPLYPLTDDRNECSVDIVAIHGLGGHPFKTWTDTDGHLWLRDSLPEHIPHARIWTYGYDSAIAFGRSRMDVGDFALDLLSRLRFERRSHSETIRPLIFICHSLGGVVLKQALLTASAQRDYYGSILTSSYGVVFMGTPHRGSRVANQARHLSRIINITSFSNMVRSDLLEVLSMSSKALQHISQLSIPILKDLVIVSFYEQKPLGPTVIVESFSAILGLPNERAMPINADHRKMARVSPRSKHLYMPVWKAVSELVDGSLNGNASKLKELLDALYSVDYKQSQLRPRQPHEGTCDWLFEDSAFKSWAMAKNSALLWLSGPPGVGKSVLTRHLVEEILGGNDHMLLPCDYLGASFFCSYNEAANNTEEAVLRSILHQLLQIHPQCQSTVRNRLQIPTAHRPLYRLKSEHLWEAIEDVLTLDAMRHCFICVDAIEELPSEAAFRLLFEFYKIVKRFRSIHPRHRLRVFISSRYNPKFNSFLKSVFILRIQPSLLRPHIEKYIWESVCKFALQNRAFAEIADRSLREDITDQIVQRADGMFLWATIAWEDFRRGLLWNRNVVKQKLRQLNSTSPGINTLYDRMMSQVDPSIRQDMWSIFAVLSIAARSLSEAELGIILAIQRSRERIVSSHDIQPFEDLNEIIESNFPDLVAINEDNSITFIHLSFKEYLFQYWSEKDPKWLEKTRHGLAQSCLTYLSLRDLVQDANGNTSVGDFYTRYPFFQYAFNFHIYHVGFVSDSDPLWLQFADLAGRRSIYAASWLYKRYDSPLLAVVEHFKSPSLVTRFAEHGYDLDEKWRPSSHTYTALGYCCLWAKEPKMEELASLLLELGANPNDFIWESWRTLLQMSIEMGVWDLYRQLVHHPHIDLNLRNDAGQTALHYVVRFGDTSVLSEFLHLEGFDINAQDVRGHRPLHLATMFRQLEKMKLLLNVDGIRLDGADNQGRTPLTVATYWGFRDAALVLIAHSKAFPTPKTDEMSSLICAAKQDDQYLTQALLEKYEYKDLDCHLDLSGKTVLHHAAINDWPTIIENTLSNASGQKIINSIDHSGGSALHYAAALGHTTCARVLLKCGASVRLQDRNGRTAAHAAADAGFKDTLMLLLRAGDVDANQRDHQGRNLAHWAASIDCVDVMGLIFSRWPEVELTRKDNLFLLPIDIARVCKCANVGRFVEREMGRRGQKSALLETYNWDSMYNSSLVEVVEEDEATISAKVRKQLELIQQQEMWRVWDELHRQYPEHTWALTTLR